MTVHDTAEITGRIRKLTAMAIFSAFLRNLSVDEVEDRYQPSEHLEK